MQRPTAMPRNRVWALGALLIAALAGTGCSDDAATATSPGVGPATLITVAGSGEPTVVLTDRAAQRLGLETAVVEAGEGDSVGSVPYGAVVYDANGGAWVYATTDTLTYARTPIEVIEVRDDRAHLAAGPDVGTEVVTVGTAELYGVEQGIGA